MFDPFILASFLLALGHGMGFIAIPLYAGLMGASVFQLGLFGTLFSLSYALCCSFSGSVSDRLGRRWVLIPGCLLTSLAFLGMGTIQTIFPLMLLNALVGVTAAFAWPTLMAWFGDAQGGKALDKGLGLFNAAMSLGMTIGPLMGGMLFELHPAWPFWIAGGLALPVPLLLAGVPSHREKRIRLARTPGKPAVHPQIQRTFLQIGWMANFTGWFAHNTVRSLFPQLATNLGMSPGLIGFLLSLLRLSQTATYVVMGRQDGWHFRLGPLLSWQLLALPALLLIFWGVSALSFGVAFLLLGVLLGVTFQSSLYYSLQGGTETGKRSGWNESILAGGGLLGPFLGGLIGGPFGLQAPYLLCFLMMALGIGGEMGWLRRARGEIQKEALVESLAQGK